MDAGEIDVIAEHLELFARFGPAADASGKGGERGTVRVRADRVVLVGSKLVQAVGDGFKDARRAPRRGVAVVVGQG